MPSLSYRRTGLAISRGGRVGTRDQIRDLQRDLRRLGYLQAGIDGAFGRHTERAVKALQHDLLHRVDRRDGAPVDVLDYNRGRVVAVTGVCDRALADCISDMLDDPRYPQLPRADDAPAENRRLAAAIDAIVSDDAPTPFVKAVLTQESRITHYHEPRGRDEDSYLVVGFDANAGEQHVVTSRGYGAGQYTLFYHPPTAQDVRTLMLDIRGNLRRAYTVLRDKLDRFVNGPTSGTRADDRMVEIGDGPLRRCRYEPEDPRYFSDCVRCAVEAGPRRITAGVTRLHAGTAHRYAPTIYYRRASYEAVPRRERIGCDWPYADRRYNGSGVNSYHYQTRVLMHLARQPLVDRGVDDA